MVRKIRFERDLSQADFAAKLQRRGWDVSREMVAKIETKRRQISDLELMFLCRLLEVSPNRMLGKI